MRSSSWPQGGRSPASQVLALSVLLASTVLLSLWTVHFWRIAVFFARAGETTGTVVEVRNQAEGEDSPNPCEIIAYSVEGSRFETTGRCGPGNAVLNRRVTLAYDRSAPAVSREVSFRATWLPEAGVFIFLLACGVGGGAAFKLFVYRGDFCPGVEPLHRAGTRHGAICRLGVVDRT